MSATERLEALSKRWRGDVYNLYFRCAVVVARDEEHYRTLCRSATDYYEDLLPELFYVRYGKETFVVLSPALALYLRDTRD